MKIYFFINKIYNVKKLIALYILTNLNSLIEETTYRPNNINTDIYRITEIASETNLHF